MKTQLVFEGTTGLNVAVDPVRTAAPSTRVSSEDGRVLVQLISCKDVDIDRTGAVKTRKGFSLLRTGSFHSLFNYPEAGGILAVYNGFLSLIPYNNGDVVKQLRQLSSNAKMHYAKAVTGSIYYCNGTESGKIKDGILSEINFKTTLPFSTKLYQAPPFSNAEILCIHQGRLFFSVKNVVYFSEAFSFETFNVASSFFILEGQVISMQSVDKETLAIGTETAFYLVKGEVTTSILEKIFEAKCFDIKPLSRELQKNKGNEVLVLTNNGVILVSVEEGKWIFILEERARLKTAKAGTITYLSEGKFIFNWR